MGNSSCQPIVCQPLPAVCCCGADEATTVVKDPIKAPAPRGVERYTLRDSLHEPGPAGDAPFLPDCCVLLSSSSGAHDRMSMPSYAPAAGYGGPDDDPLVPEAFCAKHLAATAQLETISEVGLMNSPCGPFPGEDPFDTLTEVERKLEAKKVIKNFVTTMVKGTRLTVVTPTGDYRDCFLTLTRELDTLKIQAVESKSGNTRAIPLTSIDEIVAGTDTAGNAVAARLQTPLDDLCVTLVLQSADCVSFRLPDIEKRDTLVMCLTIFINARSKVASPSW